MPEQKDNTITLESLKSLKEKVKENGVNYDDFKKIYENLQNQEKEFLSLLEWAYQLKPEDKDLIKLARKTGIENISNIVEELTNLGYGVQKELGEDFEKQGYRLLEQTRAGKRSDVMYGITRIFMTHKRNLPEVLNEAFKLRYDIETFKCFMYAFLGSAIKPKENKTEEE